MCILESTEHRPGGSCRSAQQSPKVFELVPGGDSCLSGSIGDTDAILHVGRPPKQDIEHVPLGMQSSQVR
jgi:hypothetical protein